MVIPALGITAPLESRTVPEIVAVVTWQMSRPGSAAQITAKSIRTIHCAFTLYPLSYLLLKTGSALHLRVRPLLRHVLLQICGIMSRLSEGIAQTKLNLP